METYLFKFSACLAVFWLVYVLFLERQNMHRFKRFYLLSTVVLALIIPALTNTHYIEPVITEFEMPQMYLPMESSFVEMPQEEPPFMDLETILWMLYGFGVLLFTIRFALNLFKMYKRISNNETITKRSFIYVLLEECRIPHSFFKYIFFNKSTYKTDSIPREVQLHEETHAKQLHSLDIIVIELLQIVFWFHPLIYILKHHIKLNHEFLADQAVLNQGSDTKTYQNILLQFSSSTQDYQLSSAINYSSIKKRFTVMKTNTSKTRIWLSSLLLLPIIAILFYSFAEREYIEKQQIDPVAAIVEELQKANKLNVNYVDGATPAMMKEYNDWIKKLNNNSSSLFIPVGTWERLAAIYDIMNEEQRNSVETYPYLQEAITPNLYSVKPSKPSPAQFESWKNEKEFAIWLDRQHISNSTLNKYSVNDIVHFVDSKVNENAQSEKFPQSFQINLYSKDGFNKFFVETFINDYKSLTKTYTNEINTYLKGLQTDNSELRILKAQADKFYNQFTKENIEKYNILMAPPVPAQNRNVVVQKPIMWILINRKDQILVDDEIGTLESIENKLKKLAKEGKAGQLVSIKFDKETSKDVILQVERLVKANKFKVVSFDASKIPPPPPPPPAQKKTKGGPNVSDAQESYNPSFLEYIIEMEQLGASFYLDDKKITAKKAKAIATNHDGKRTEMTTQKDSNGHYVVKLSSAEKKKIYARSIELKILNDNSYLIDDIKATKKTFIDVFNQLHQDITPEIRNNVMNIHVSSSKEISDKETWFIYNSLQDYGFYRIVTPTQEINRAKGNTPFAIESHLSTQEKATAKQVAEYNKLAKHCNSQIESEFPIIKVKHIKRIEYLYGKMSKDQKKNAESYPDFSKIPPPLPPPAKQQKATVKQVSEYNAWAKQLNASDNKIIKRGELKKYTHIYNIMTAGQKNISVAFPKIPPPPPPPTKAKQYKNGNKLTLNEIIKQTPKGVESGYEMLENRESHYYTVHKGKKTYYNSNGYITDKKGNVLPPPPPAPESTLDFVIRMAKANAKFFNEGKSISSDKAIALIKKNNKLNINANEKGIDGKPLVYISKRPIHIGVKGKVGEPFSQKQKNILPIINGKKIKTGKLSMKLDDIRNLKLTLPSKEIISFKFKIPGIKTQHITGNTITDETIKNLSNVKTGDYITLFDIKYKGDSKISPLVIEIID